MIASSVGSPRRSSSALVATVVPILTASIAAGRQGLAMRQPEQVANALERRVLVLVRVVRKKLVDSDLAVRRAPDHIGEGAAAVDPELPAAALHHGHELNSPLPAQHRRRAGRVIAETARQTQKGSATLGMTARAVAAPPRRASPCGPARLAV